MLNLNFTPFPLLVSERLILRQLSILDKARIFSIRSDERVNEFIDRPKSINQNEAASFIEKINNGIKNNECIYWGITLQDEDMVIGTICLWNIDSEKNLAEIGYELHPDFQGKGFISEAVEKVIDYGFNKMRLAIIIALTHPKNKRSEKVLLKNNFISDKQYKYIKKEEVGNLLVYYLKKNSFTVRK